jgi:hypothetical protein
VASDHHAQVATGHQPRLAVGALKSESTVLGVVVVVTMPDEVQYVVLTQAERPLQRRERAGLQPVRLDHAPVGQVSQ